MLTKADNLKRHLSIYRHKRQYKHGKSFLFCHFLTPMTEFGGCHAGLFHKYTVKCAHRLKAGCVGDLSDVGVGMEKLVSGKISPVNVQEPFEVHMKVTVKPSG